jgi:hypothetical protein
MSKTNFQEVLGTAIGGVTGFITTGFYDTWVQPVLISGLCALFGLLITHYGKKILKYWKL